MQFIKTFSLNIIFLQKIYVNRKWSNKWLHKSQGSMQANTISKFRPSTLDLLMMNSQKVRNEGKLARLARTRPGSCHSCRPGSSARFFSKSPLTTFFIISHKDFNLVHSNINGKVSSNPANFWHVEPIY